VQACAQGAISWNGDAPITDPDRCDLCGACVDACYAEAREMAGHALTLAQVMAEIEQDVAFYDESGGGATFSGGEPLAQPDFLLALLQACREREIHTALDTCGFASWKTVDRIRDYVDLFLYDLKLMDDSRHRIYTGVPNQLILSNLQALSQRGHAIILRVPIIPGLNDDDDNLGRLGTFAAALPGLERVDLLPYHHAGAGKYARLKQTYRLPDTHPPSVERMAEIAHYLAGFDLELNIGG
jgi:pyruvate formate lyase activating enzyme